MEEDKSRVERFFSSVVIPAFQEAKKELERGNKKISVYIGSGYIGKPMEEVPVLFSVPAGRRTFSYAIKVRTFGKEIYPYPLSETRGEHGIVGGIGHFKSTHFDISELTKEEIVRNLLQAYESFKLTNPSR